MGLTQPVTLAHARRSGLRSYLGKTNATDFIIQPGHTFLIVGEESSGRLQEGKSMSGHCRSTAVLAVLFVGFLLGSFAHAQSIIIEEYPVTQTPAWETTPRLGNDGTSDLVVYTSRSLQADGTLGKGDIWYQRLKDGQHDGGAIQVTSDPITDYQLNDVSGNYIVYTAYESTTSMAGQIMLYQISTKLYSSIGSAFVIQEPRICGNKVVWIEGAAGASELMLYDLSWLGTAMNAIVIAGPIPPVSDVEIGDRFVVWAELNKYASNNEQLDVVAFDLNASVRINLTSTPTTNETQASTSGPWITWQAQDQGQASSRVIAENMDTGELRTVADNGAYNARPTIDGDLISYETLQNGYRVIYVYRLSTMETIQVTVGGIDNYLNDVFGNEVTYVDQRTGNEDIYVSTLTFAVTTDPSSASVCVGDTVNFTAAAAGNPAPTVQWQVSTDGGTTWNDISGATSTTLMFTANASDNGNQYRAVFTYTAGTATSKAATLTVNPVPVITTNPSSQSVNSGSMVSFTAATSDVPAPTVQWQVSTDGGATWSNISGATSTTLSFTATPSQNGNQYLAVFTNHCGTAMTTAATLTVTAIPPMVSFTGAPTSAPYGATFSVTATTNASTTAVITASGACSIVGNTVTMTSGTGICSLTANWAADANYAAASLNQATAATKIAPVIAWATPAPIAYGTPLSGAQLNATASVQGTFVYSPTPGTVLGAGPHILSATFTPNDPGDYNTATAQVTLQVNQATPVIAWTPASIQLGYLLGAAQLDASANVLGTFTYTPPLGTPIMTTSQTLSVLFTPTDASDYTTASMSVPLTVTPGPLAGVSPSSIDFGTVYLGTITIKNVTVTNLGNAPMTITDPFLSIVSGGNSNEFVMANLCPKPLAAGKSCTIVVSFIAGPHYTPQTATIQVIDNAPGSPQTVILTATVINPQANFKPMSLNFGTQSVNSSTTNTVTLTNTGATTLNITSIAITGPNAADFTQSSACPTSLAASASCTIPVTFTPISKNTFSAGLTVTDNAFLSKQTIPLTGTGH